MPVARIFSESTVAHLPAMHRYARALVGEQGADDLVQEAMARAYKSYRSFRPDGNLRNWLFSILHNCFVSEWRRERAEHEGRQALMEGSVAHISPSQEHAFQLREVAIQLASLPIEQREMLHLVVAEGLSYQAAADIVGVPMGTVMSRLGRARAALRKALGGPIPILRIVESGRV